LAHFPIHDPADGGVVEGEVVGDRLEGVVVGEVGLANPVVALRSSRLADPGKHGGERRTVGTVASRSEATSEGCTDRPWPGNGSGETGTLTAPCPRIPG
jgi:hypothetical protein